MNAKYPLAVFVGTAVLLTGCVVQSLQPLFTAPDFVPCPALVGTWVQSDDGRTVGRWSFVAEGNKYICTQTDEKGRTGRFEIVAGRIGTNLFLQGSLPPDSEGSVL